ncbi:hypothetical protein DINM_005341 [Dirofilaria immitis]|nr:hypothetical protein [Dirofilaria immitis]
MHERGVIHDISKRNLDDRQELEAFQQRARAGLESNQETFNRQKQFCNRTYARHVKTASDEPKQRRRILINQQIEKLTNENIKNRKTRCSNSYLQSQIRGESIVCKYESTISGDKKELLVVLC